MEVQISKQVVDFILIKDGDDIKEKVAQFVAKHKLNSAKHQKLLKLVVDNLPS